MEPIHLKEVTSNSAIEQFSNCKFGSIAETEFKYDPSDIANIEYRFKLTITAFEHRCVELCSSYYLHKNDITPNNISDVLTVMVDDMRVLTKLKDHITSTLQQMSEVYRKADEYCVKINDARTIKSNN